MSAQQAAGAQRHHWLNTFVGVLDTALHLTEEEQFLVSDILRSLLVTLRVPDRGVPQQLPAPVALEVECGYYSTVLAAQHHAGFVRPVIPAGGYLETVSVQAWRSALLGMLVVSYPDLDLPERLLASSTLDDMLAALGVPSRAAASLPTDVLRAWTELDSLTRD